MKLIPVGVWWARVPAPKGKETRLHVVISVQPTQLELERFYLFQGKSEDRNETKCEWEGRGKYCYEDRKNVHDNTVARHKAGE